MKTSLARTNAIVPFKAQLDFTGHVGRFVTRSRGTIVPVGSATDKPIGVLLTDGKDSEQVSVAISAGGLAGTVRVKLAADVPGPGIDLQLTADGRVEPDAGVRERVLVAQSLESGAVDELIEAVLFRPVALT